MKYLFKLLLALFFILLINSPIVSKELDFETIRKGVVQIKVFSQGMDPYSPWQAGTLSASTGTGFIIQKDKILTNAHVISNAKFIQVQRHNQSEWYEVKRLFVAHDCDLALLQAVNPEFYKDSYSFEFGAIPELNSPILVVGFPIGGDKISVSRGIVSRKEQSTYAHSQIDSHLVIQVDAAINPGNSGGPAIQAGKVAGVAFQVATRGENIGYLIPTTVIKYFLDDIQDGEYNGYVELGVRTMNSFNPDLRKYLNIPDNLDGVLVKQVFKGGSAEGYLQKYDLIVSIDGLPIGKNGTIILDKDTRIDFVEVVDNKHAKEPISLKVFRQGKMLELKFPAKKMYDFEYMRNSYDTGFDYLLLGGLVFQEHSRSLLQEWGKSQETQGGSQFLYRFFYFIEDGLNKDVDSDVVFYRKLAHQTNSSSDYFLNLILHSVNGVLIKNLKHMKEVVGREMKNEFIVLRFRDLKTPLILKTSEILKADQEIKKIYHLDK
ncbi:MAG: trypsin-like peptidase domain-containing protein [Leptospiraceae bacterium]|nr:trypsin-like peptidase domain-containing protein [Leptospiraceae bacterium]MCP5502472.1 trypsin-like peptidase domain-containing protein [Leptospiraceae bacterium]